MDITDQFTITLPSNVKQESYPDNRPWDYSTVLHSCIELPPGEWEVAATHLYYTHKMNNLLREDHIGVFIHYPLNPATVTDRIGDSLTDPIHHAHKAWLNASWAGKFKNKVYYRCATVPAGYYASREELGKAVAQLITKALDSIPSNINTSVGALFEIDATTGVGKFRVSHTSQAGFQDAEVPVTQLLLVSLDSTTGVLKRLGFSPSPAFVQLPLPDNMINVHPHYAVYGTIEPRLRDPPNNSALWHVILQIRSSQLVNDEFIPAQIVFVYCDLVEHSRVGNSMQQLLCPTDAFGATTGVALGPENAIFARVTTRSIRSIRIWLGNQFGDPITFRDPESAVVVVLHFRIRKPRN